VRAYFRDGVLPNPGTVCPIESKLFDNENDTTSTISAREDGLAWTLRDLKNSVTIQR
jgi:hypothetical protein